MDVGKGGNRCLEPGDFSLCGMEEVGGSASQASTTSAAFKLVPAACGGGPVIFIPMGESSAASMDWCRRVQQGGRWCSMDLTSAPPS